MTLRKLSFTAAFLIATGLAPAAHSQTVPDLLTLQLPAGNTGAVNQQNCLNGGTVALNWNFPQGVGTSINVRLTIYLTKGGSCPNDPPSDATIVLADEPITATNLTGSEQVTAQQLGGEDCPINVETDWIACAVAMSEISDLSGTRENALAKAQVALTYDSKPPSAPQITEHNAGDATVFLTWTAGEDAGDWIIFYRPVGPPPAQVGDQCGNLGTAASRQVAGDGGTDGGAGVDAGADAGAAAGPDAGSVDLTGWSSTTIEDGTLRKGSVGNLVNGQQYELLVVSRDIAGNDSAPSNIVTDTPVNVQDFYERYRCEGGSESGGYGCSTAGMALFPVAGLAGLALLLRAGRRKA